jgi:hypothetical protein
MFRERNAGRDAWRWAPGPPLKGDTNGRGGATVVISAGDPRRHDLVDLRRAGVTLTDV